ncbi:hypothetical protein PDIDSM_8614 [Penicillium digitatum]|nr:hypothetical protein PDIDSM_8614 [Penicillium digitatum]
MTPYDPIHERIEEECPFFDVEAAREMYLRQSYATFCQTFTLSGTTSIRRKFDLSMGTEGAGENPPSPHTAQNLKTNDTSEFSGSHASPEHIAVHSRPQPTTVAFPISCPSTKIDNAPISRSATVGKPSAEYPVTETSKVEDDFDRISSSFETTLHSNYPPPPPRIITPTVWMDMQRSERELKAARRKKFLNPCRSWLLTIQPLWGRIHDVVK